MSRRWPTPSRRLIAGCCTAASVAACAPAIAQAEELPQPTFATLGLPPPNREGTWWEAHGNFRVRGEALGNLDLDRGPTPSGQTLYPQPLGHPASSWLTGADVRLRTDVAVYAPGGQVSAKLRLDFLDNVALGSDPQGPAVAAVGQQAPVAPATLRRAWAEALLPFGVLAAGRMGSHWGLGMLSHGGDCGDCNSGDAADRIALVSPLFGHLVAVAYDFAAVGAQGKRVDGLRALDLDPRDDVRTWTAAVMRWHDPAAIARRRAAGRGTLDYGVYGSHRWQDIDFPAVAQPGQAQAIGRGLSATAGDLWLRWLGPSLRLEVEAVALTARIAQPTLLPGVLYRTDVQSQQFGAALQSEWGDPEQGFGVGLDAGVASGDPAPGVSPPQVTLLQRGKPGDVFGGQLDLPRDQRADDFRFHTDFRVDRILFRDLLGTVTDAAYVRPHLRWRQAKFGAGRLEADLAVVASSALYASSTPGGQRPLGVEFDPTLSYVSRDGFACVLAGGWLLPLAGLDNPAAGLRARSAGLLQVRLHYGF
jgi:uncharacterized protein (TIGR04551 family)